MSLKRIIPYVLISLLLINCTSINNKDYSTENWTQYRGPNKNGKINSMFSKNSINILWEFKYQGGTPSPMIVYKDIVYFGTLTGEVYAINKKGELYWKIKLPGKIKYSPAYHNSFVIVSSTSGVIFGIDSKNGHIKWKYKLNNSSQFVHPIIDNGKVYITCYEKIVVLESETGKLLNEIKKVTNNGFDHQPLFTKDAIYISSNRVCKYDKETGELIWKSKLDYFYEFCKSGPYLYKDTLYMPQRIWMNGFNIKNGEEVEIKHFSPEDNQGIIDNDKFYYTHSHIGHFSTSNYLECESMTESKNIFNLSENNGSSMNRGSIGDIILVGDYIYFYTDYQQLNCVNKNTGKLIYIKDLPSEDLLGTPIYSNGKFYLRSGQFETDKGENTIFALK